MKKLTKLMSTLLVISMLLSNVVYAEELIETDTVSNKITSTISYGADKVKNTVIDIFSTTTGEDNGLERIKEKFKNPGMELTEKDINGLYDMGYSMMDISNAIKLSKQCDETPYDILQMKGLKSADFENQISLMADDTDSENSSDSISEEKTWQEVQQELNLLENVEIEENSEIIYDGEPDDIQTIFKQLEISDILQENGFQESEISEAIETGVLESVETNENDEECIESDNNTAVILTQEPGNDEEISLMSVDDEDSVITTYNGSIYPLTKYNAEKTSGYTVETGYDINPVSGNLMVVENDLSLEGINGLDLNLTRVYSSERANMLDATVDISDEDATRKIGYYRVNAGANISITYRESSANGGSLKTVNSQATLTLLPPQDDERGFPIYTAIDQGYADEQIESGNITSLFNHATEADQARTDAYDGKYDKTISFSSGSIQKINISIINDMDCITREECYVTIPGIPYYTTEQFINKSKSFSDLGVGWEFDFPYIEIKDEKRYIDDELVDVPYEYLHYGTRGTWLFDSGVNYSNLDGYLLKDMKLTYYSGTFDSRSTEYLLTESNGKKYYFGNNGELLGIEDRFGNKIRFYYGNNLHGYYVLNKIIDSVGREITFDYSRSTNIQAYDPLSQSNVTATRYFIDIVINDPNTNTSKTITYAKDKILGVGLTYTDIDGEEHISDITDNLNFQPNPSLYNLSLVTDSEGLSTKYSYSNSYGLLSMTDKNLEAHGTEIPYSNMTIITYPTGATCSFNKSSITDNFGTDGIRKYQTYTSALLLNKYYNEDENKISNNRVSNESITHNTSVQDDSSSATQIQTASGYPHYRNIKEMPHGIRYVVGIRQKNIDVTNSDDTVLTTNAYTYQNDEILLADSTVEALGKETVDGITSYPAYVRETTSYTYNNNNLCTNQETKTFSDPESTTHTNFVSNSVQRTYDAWGDVLTEKLNGDTNRTTTCEYDSEYHYPTKKTYKSDSGTSIIENYTPSSDHKTITESTVLENNSTKKKSTYEYDSHGNVTKVNQYGVNGNMSQYATITYAYADSDNVISNAYVTSATVSNLKNVDGTALSAVQQNIVYDYFGNIIKETDCNGNIYQYEYDKNNRLTKVINPHGSYRTYTYTVQYENTTTSKIAKNEVTERNENGKIIRHDYNSIGNLVSEYNVTDEKQISSYEYPFANGQNVVQTYSDVNNASRTVISYDAIGRKTSSEVIDNDGNTLAKQTYAYEVLPTEKQFKTTTTTIGDTTAEDVKNIQYTDIYGNIVKEETVYNENNTEKTAVTTYTYDYLGNVKTVREPRAAAENWSATQYTAQYEYDVDGNVTKETDINGKSIVNTYDGVGNLISITDKNGNTTTNTYDNLGRLLKEQIPFQKNGTSTVYATNKYYYDANGNMIKSQTANNAVGSSASYTTTEYTYNWQNQPTKVRGFNGDDVESCVQYYYDSVGNILRMYTGDVDGLTISGLDQVSGSDDYAVTKYTYDSMNRCKTQTDALGKKVTNTYDINGNLIKTVDRNGNTLSYTYDGLNQLTQKSSSKTTDDTYTYAYNKKGLRTSMTGGGVNSTYVYNNLGQLAKETLTNGIVKEYTYDMNGNRKSFKLTKDNTVQYTLTYDYDKRNQLTKVYEDGTVKAEYTYNDDGTLKKSSYGSQTTDYTYNLANLLTEVTNANGSTQISNYSYTYYVDGNQKSKTESVAGTSNGTTNYTYDGLNRLVQEQTPDNTYSYQYDSYGNRSQLSVTGDENYTTTYTYDKNNRMRNQTKTSGNNSEITDYWYDPNGNQISSMTVSTGGTGTVGIGIELAGGNTNSMSEYNSWNQLTSTMQNGKTASYTYNGDGLRMSKTFDGVTTSHIWDGTNIAGDITNGTVTKYIRGLQLISSKKGSNESFYTYNGHGDVVQLTNGTGAITKQYSYDAFGVEKDKADNDTNPFRYCGEYYDTETDSVYLRARYYRPNTGRFITEDPIRDGLNWYVYCSGNPTAFIDPSGEGWIKDSLSEAWEGAKNALTWVWNESNELQKSIQRKFWKKGGEIILSNAKGYSTSAWMLEHSLQDNPSDIYRDNNSRIAYLVNTDNAYLRALDNAIANSRNNRLDNYLISVAFENGDLYYSIHKSDIYLTGYKRDDGKWIIHAVLEDDYDFTEIQSFMTDSGDWSWDVGLGTAANDVAFVSQNLGAIQPYHVTVDFWTTR